MKDVKIGHWTFGYIDGAFGFTHLGTSHTFEVDQSEVEQLHKAIGEWLAERADGTLAPGEGARILNSGKADAGVVLVRGDDIPIRSSMGDSEGARQAPLTIEGAHGKRLIVHRDTSITVVIGGDPYHRDEFTKLIAWGMEWLDKHPVPIERWLVIRGDNHTLHTTEVKARTYASHMSGIEVIKPVTYHKGEGLTDG